MPFQGEDDKIHRTLFEARKLAPQKRPTNMDKVLQYKIVHSVYLFIH